MNGKVCYLSADHEYFVAGTIKENVIMGEKFDPVKFAKIMDLLEFDLSRFPAGEQMEILPNTENISIDEKKKLLLARVLYQDGDIYCLDECFDNWRPEMAERIFHRIVNTLMKDKTIIYSTLQNKLIQRADTVLYFSNGEIQQQGSYIELLCDYKKEFFRVMIGRRARNWRR
jgi:ATP-binding cassette subfamily C (CFTR/MRP) protein 1